MASRLFKDWSLGRVLHGARGLWRAGLGLDRADEAVIQHRRAACRRCEHAIPCRHAVTRMCACAVCGCRLRAKIVLASEACPLGRWDTPDAPSA
jgi:hypothetical protein